MALSDFTSPTAVKLAIKECDRLGREPFLNQYGFGLAREYVLRYNGMKYDSKAIGCVAHAFQNPELGVLRDVSGGKDAVGKRVFDLGFDVDGLERRPEDWTLSTCEVTADGYFQCLARKLRKEPYNRAATCRDVAAQIGRTKGAVDRKFQNIDAVLFENSLPRMMNAVARNVQHLLRYVVLDPLAGRLAAFGSVAEVLPPLSPTEDAFIPVPDVYALVGGIEAKAAAPSIGRKIDFAGRDKKNAGWAARANSGCVTLRGRPYSIITGPIWLTVSAGSLTRTVMVWDTMSRPSTSTARKYSLKSKLRMQA